MNCKLSTYTYLYIIRMTIKGCQKHCHNTITIIDKVARYTMTVVHLKEI